MANFNFEKEINWNEEKNKFLKQTRGISFDEVEKLIKSNIILDVKEHSNKDKYPNQKMLIVQIKNYGYIVPFVENENEIFLKTIIPSRKITKLYNLKG